MGGRGTYSAGQSPKYNYKTVGKIGDVKILAPIDKAKALKLPEESHTAGNKYVLLDKDGVFHQYREYNSNHEVALELGIATSDRWVKEMCFISMFTGNRVLTTTIVRVR